MLACADRANGPLEMQTVRQWDVDGIDVWVVNDFFKTSMVSLAPAKGTP